MQKAALYQSLVSRNFIQASAVVVAKLGLLPWVLFFGLMMALDLAGSNPNDAIAMTVWTGTQLACILGFLLWANLQLACRFRRLASEPRSRRIFAPA